MKHEGVQFFLRRQKKKYQKPIPETSLDPNFAMSPEQDMPLGENDLGILTSTPKVTPVEEGEKALVTSSFGEFADLEPKIEKTEDYEAEPSAGHKPGGGGAFYDAFYDRDFAADRVRESQKCLAYGGEKIREEYLCQFVFFLQ